MSPADDRLEDWGQFINLSHCRDALVIYGDLCIMFFFCDFVIINDNSRPLNSQQTLTLLEHVTKNNLPSGKQT